MSRTPILAEVKQRVVRHLSRIIMFIKLHRDMDLSTGIFIQKILDELVYGTRTVELMVHDSVHPVVRACQALIDDIQSNVRVIRLGQYTALERYLLEVCERLSQRQMQTDGRIIGGYYEIQHKMEMLTEQALRYIQSREVRGIDEPILSLKGQFNFILLFNVVRWEDLNSVEQGALRIAGLAEALETVDSSERQRATMSEVVDRLRGNETSLTLGEELFGCDADEGDDVILPVLVGTLARSAQPSVQFQARGGPGIDYRELPEYRTEGHNSRRRDLAQTEDFRKLQERFRGKPETASRILRGLATIFSQKK